MLIEIYDAGTKKLIWNSIEKKWPVPFKNKIVTFTELQKQARDFLANYVICIEKLSHFGIVVKNINQSLEFLFNFIDKSTYQLPYKDRVVAYNVYVTRLDLEGIELELIEPYGESFFFNFLNTYGECLQHISFQVANIEQTLATLDKHKVKLIDKKPHIGSHGKVAFIYLKQLDPLHLEICQSS